MNIKILTIFFIILLGATIVLGSIYNKEYEINKSSSIFLEGKNISVVSISKDTSVLFDVDGSRDKIKNGETKTVSGVSISIADVFGTSSTIVNITINFTCGNLICEPQETPKICCTDCNCTGSFTCSLNRCLDPLKTTCNTNNGCNDNNKCTNDICSELTKTCINDPVRKCSNDDTCCPYGCTKSTDNDCKIGSCSSDKDCNDNNKCSKDKCINGICQYEGNECESNGECNPAGIVINNTYCLDKTWHTLKTVNISCKNAYECLSNTCQEGKCKERDSSLVTKKIKTEVNKYTYAAMIILVLLIIIEIIILIKKKY